METDMITADFDYSVGNNRYFVPLLISAFANMIETEADKQMEEITWKQYLVLILIKRFFDENRSQYPTLGDLAESMGSSHQSVKELILRLEKKGFVLTVADKDDKKKQRVQLTDHCYEYFNHRMAQDDILFSRAFDGITNEQVADLVKIILRIDNNLSGNKSSIKIQTHEKDIIEATTFRKSRILPRRKDRPRFQLYASNGAVLAVSGINRHIIGFYDNEEDIDLEMEELFIAIKNNERGYRIKYATPVKYDRTGLPVINRDS